MIHIVHIIPSLSYGGAERMVVDIINNSNAKNFHFSIIVFGQNNFLKKQLTSKHVKVYNVNKKGKISLHLFKDLEEKLRELKPDIVHTHLFGADFWGRVAAKRLDLPVVTTEHNFNENEGALKNSLKKYLRDKTNVYTTCSFAVKEYAAKKYSIDSNIIQVIDCAVDLAKFKDASKVDFGVEKINFLMLGRLSKQKGHALSLQALAEINSKKWKLSIVGDGELKSSLERYVKKLNIVDNVEFLPFVDDVSEVLDSCQILLFPSLWEGLGIVAREAMSAGRVVIASSTGGIPEYIEDSVTGYLVETGNVDALKNKIQWCLANTDKLEQVATNAKKYAKENFAIKTMVQKYEKIYKSLSK